MYFYFVYLFLFSFLSLKRVIYYGLKHKRQSSELDVKKNDYFLDYFIFLVWWMSNFVYSPRFKITLYRSNQSTTATQSFLWRRGNSNFSILGTITYYIFVEFSDKNFCWIKVLRLAAPNSKTAKIIHPSPKFHLLKK